MGYYKELKKTMTPEKKEFAKKDWFAFYVGRPLSYLLTIPFLVCNFKPNTISVISTVEVVFASVVLAMGHSRIVGYAGVLLFFIWNLLDGVDGNIARMKKNGTPIGSTFDAMSGYAAMFLIFFSAGIYTYNINGNAIFIIIGAVSGMSMLFPRLIMHKAAESRSAGAKADLGNRKNFTFVQTLALNLTSVAGLMQPLLLLAVIFNLSAYYTVFYCVLNVAVMLVSLKRILTN